MSTGMKKLALALVAALLPGTALASTLVTNANGIQSDEHGALARFNGFLIGDDGKVEAVFKANDQLPKADKVVDVGGRTVLPGLIDAHGHVMGLGQALLTLDLVGTQSIDELKARLKDYAAANPGSGWIVGRGWNQELWPVKAFPTAADLDAVVSDRPVMLERVDGHAVVANSKAMELAKVTAATQAPSGGRIENGLFVDTAEEIIHRAIPDPTPQDLDRALAAAQDAMLSVGLVGAADMGTSVAGWEAMRRAGEAGNLKVRIFSYAAGLDNWRDIHDGVPTGWEFGDRLALVGTKLYADGALGSRGALLKKPYSDKPDTHGLAVTPLSELDAAADKVAENGGQVAIHAIGDEANAEVIGIYEKIGAKYGRYHRPRIEHFQIVDPKDIPRLKPAGIVASMQPTHQTSDRLMAEARLGKGRLAGAYAWNTVLKLGIPLAFGSDFPVESPNPFPGLMAAVSREDMDGQPPGGWIPNERITLAQALHAFTRGAAYAGFTEKVMGAIEPGHWADFIVIDRDPTSDGAQSIGKTKVLETWVAGEKVFSAPN
jgi:predicted amidohydrolase YtcJ